MPDTAGSRRPPDPWDAESLKARIRDERRRERFPAGSPDAAEIEAYAAGFPPTPHRGRAVVLGITPELRTLAARHFAEVITVEWSRRAIDLYASWLAPALSGRERLVEGDWFNVREYVQGEADVVLGDGVFGNLPDVAAHGLLLRRVAAVLAPHGRFVTRKALIPEGFRPEEDTQARLVERFRAGELDEAEFGFAVRLLGHFNCCYGASTFLLDNGRLFRECEEDFRSGGLSRREHECIRRYYFGGVNCIVPQRLWEETLVSAGFDFSIIPCRGKDWYRYYKVYRCFPSCRPGWDCTAGKSMV